MSHNERREGLKMIGSRYLQPAIAFLAAAAPVTASHAADQRLLIQGQLNGRPAAFALDTGTSFAFALPERNLAKLGLRIDQNVSGEVVKGFSNPVSIALPPNFSADNVRLAVAADGPATLEWEFDALIGWDGMRRMPLLFESRARKLVLGGTLIEPQGATTYPVIQSSVLLFDADPGPGSLPILIDTGWSGGVRLSADLWKAWREKNGGSHTLMTEFSPNHGLAIIEQVFVASFDIGGLKLRNVLVSPMPQARIANVTEKAVLGLDAFANHRLLINGIAGKVLIGKAETALTTPPYNRLGATFIPPSMSARVAPGSPAAAADIRDGDVLVLIDDVTPMEYASRRPERNVWEQPAGTKVVLTLERAGSRVTKEVTLQDFLQP